MNKKHRVLSDRYILRDTIGEGGFSVVWKAFDIVKKKNVAIKIIQLKNDRTKKLIRDEIKILSLLKNPFIVEFYDFIEDRETDYAYIVMEYIKGSNLNELIGKFPTGICESDAKKYFWQMVDALRYLHSNNICHRDIKAHNFIVTKENDIKLIDFGLSKILQDGQDFCNTKCGTVAYFSPERIINQNYSFAADVWSLGVLLFALVDGNLPFSQGNQKQLTLRIMHAEPSYDKQKFSPELIDLLKKMLRKEPKKRITLQEVVMHPWLKEIYDKKSKYILPKLLCNAQVELDMGTQPISAKGSNKLKLRVRGKPTVVNHLKLQGWRSLPLPSLLLKK